MIIFSLTKTNRRKINDAETKGGKILKTIKEILAEVRESLTDEELSKVSTMLKEIERTADNIVDDLKSANAESKSRKLKIRELEKEIDTLKEQGSELETIKKEMEELKSYKEKYEEYQQKQIQTKKNEWEEKLKLLTVPEDDPNYQKFQKIREKFILPEKEEELTIDVIEKNLERFSLLETAGLFGGSKEIPENPQGSGGGTHKIKDPLDLD